MCEQRTSTWKGQHAPAACGSSGSLTEAPDDSTGELLVELLVETAEMVALPAASECGGEFVASNSFQSWLFTPPSVAASGSWDELLVSPLHNCAVLQDADQDESAATMPLRIHVRKARVLLFASAFVALQVALIVLFAHGVPVATIRDSRSEDERHELVNRYNFYSGTTASLVAKPFETSAGVLLPVLYFVFATKRCLFDDSLRWKAVAMLAQALFVTMLTSAFNSLFVQQRSPQISPVVIDADLFSIRNAAPPPDSQQEGSKTDPFALKATVDTVLSTAMQAAYVKSGRNRCETPGEWLHIAATHSISSASWLKEMLPNGRAPAQSVQVTVGELVGEKKTSQKRRALPFSTTTATNLLLHAMINSETILPWLHTSGMVNSSYDVFLQRATTLSASSNSDDASEYLYAASLMLNSSLSDQAATLNFSTADATLNFSRFELSSDIVFEAVTIDIPLKAKLMERKLVVNDIGSGLKQVFEVKRATANASTSAVYDVSTAYECGVDACLIEDPFFTSESLQGDVRTTTPQIQAFAPCAFAGGSEDITRDYLHGEECTARLNTSILIYSVAKRIVADEMVLDPPGLYPETRKGHFVNIRRYQTVTMGRLTWRTQDLAGRFNARCEADEGDCRGLSFRLEGGAVSRHLIVGEKHLPLDALGPFLGPRSQWTPLVVLTSTVKGDLLFKRNVKKSTNWTMNWMCSDAVETFARQIDGNRWYMEHGVQEAYTAALFFLFQNAAVHEERERVDKERTLNFAGSRVEFTLEAKIPLQSALVSIGGSALLLLSVLLLVVVSKREESAIRGGLDAHHVAKVLLVDQSFPKVFLQCSLDDPPRREKKPLEHFRIQTLSLQQLGRADIQLPPCHHLRKRDAAALHV